MHILFLYLSFCVNTYAMKREYPIEKNQFTLKRTKACEFTPIPTTTKFGDSFLMAHAYNGDLEKLERYIKTGHSINDQDKSPLNVAAYKGFKEIVEKLLPFYSNKESYNTAFLAAIYQGHLEIASLLISKGADIHTHNNLAFKFSYAKGTAQTLKYLEQLENIKFDIDK